MAYIKNLKLRACAGALDVRSTTQVSVLLRSSPCLQQENLFNDCRDARRLPAKIPLRLTGGYAEQSGQK